jgi:hypothetical protein
MSAIAYNLVRRTGDQVHLREAGGFSVRRNLTSDRHGRERSLSREDPSPGLFPLLGRASDHRGTGEETGEGDGKNNGSRGIRRGTRSN